MLVFDERGKPEHPGENLSSQSREPTNSIHIWHRVRKSNSGHIGGRQVLSPLGQPCHGNSKSTRNFKEKTQRGRPNTSSLTKAFLKNKHLFFVVFQTSSAHFSRHYDKSTPSYYIGNYLHAIFFHSSGTIQMHPMRTGQYHRAIESILRKKQTNKKEKIVIAKWLFCSKLPFPFHTSNKQTLPSAITWNVGAIATIRW